MCDHSFLYIRCVQITHYTIMSKDIGANVTFHHTQIEQYGENMLDNHRLGFQRNTVPIRPFMVKNYVHLWSTVNYHCRAALLISYRDDLSFALCKIQKQHSVICYLSPFCYLAYSKIFLGTEQERTIFFKFEIECQKIFLSWHFIGRSTIIRLQF